MEEQEGFVVTASQNKEQKNAVLPKGTAVKNEIKKLDLTNPYSYKTILQDIQRFRVSTFNEGDYYDFPSYTFFKIFFHFANGSDITIGAPAVGYNGGYVADIDNDAFTGLISPGWMLFNEDPDIALTQALERENWGKLWQHSCAWNYFAWNGDKYRASCAAKFIELLANINSKSPWYFQKIKGMDNASKREVVNFSGEQPPFEVKNTRLSVTIDCIEDSHDQRIGTLLDLYRAMVWDWQNKREMLPVNLRKFDMTVVQFQIPVRGTHVPDSDSIVPSDYYKAANIKDVDTRSSSEETNSTKADNSSTQTGEEKTDGAKPAPTSSFSVIYPYDNNHAPVSSFKAFEFHGCEIDYGASSSGYSEFDNSEPHTQIYSIPIFYDDMVELRGNEFLGNFIMSDVQIEAEMVALPWGEKANDVKGADPEYAEYGDIGLDSDGWSLSGEVDFATIKSDFNTAKSEKLSEYKRLSRPPRYTYRQSKLLNTLTGYARNKAQTAINDTFNFLNEGTRYMNGAEMTKQVNKKLNRALYGDEFGQATVASSVNGFRRSSPNSVKNIFNPDGSPSANNQVKTGEMGTKVDLGNLYADNIRNRTGALSNS